MRLFRKSKTAQETPDLVQESPEDYYDHQPSAPAPPPPALQLNFELPLMTPSSLDFGGPIAPENKNKEDMQLLAQMQQQHAEKTFSMTNPNTNIGGATNIVPLVQIIGERQNAPSYNFEYPLQMSESSSTATPSNQGDHVKHQLLEQFGHKLPTSHQESKQSGVASSGVSLSAVKTTENIFSNFAYSQPPRTSSVQQSNEQIMNVGNARVDFQQLTGSHTSKEDGLSSSEDDNAKLNNSMAAMSIGDKKLATGADGGLKMSNRALYIQRMREASALGKVAAFKPQFFETGRDDDDESDDMPLGGLRQMRAEHGVGSGTLNGMSTISGGAQTLASQQQQQHQCKCHYNFLPYCWGFFRL
ncbi:hypothetical protein H4S08_000382 [Coemansia sp. RSA 1365]|nr:hypothetical protein H4S08_000382 [Coemansia sp. RSA 1365]